MSGRWLPTLTADICEVVFACIVCHVGLSVQVPSHMLAGVSVDILVVFVTDWVNKQQLMFAACCACIHASVQCLGCFSWDYYL